MPSIRASFFVLSVFALACSRDSVTEKQPTAQSSSPQPVLPHSRFAATGWPDDAGPVVVVPSAREDEVRLIMPELTDATLTDTSSFDLDSLPHSQVTLFSRSQKSTPAVISGGGTEDTPRGCKSWPSARLDSYKGNGWSFGLAADVARELPLHIWGNELSADSVQAAHDVILIAAAAPTDSTFTGIPFSIRYLYRLELGSVRVVVADVVRRINTEANVREEHVLVIAERAASSGRYTPAYREIQTGREEVVKVPEIMGAVLLGENRRPAILVSLEYSEGSRLVLLERERSSKWALRWRSAYSGC